jgi:hypothetical protein
MTSSPRRPFSLLLRAVPLAAGLVAFPALAQSAPPAAGGDWNADLGKWRSERFERLSAPDGWLSLVGRFWLQEGDNRLGSSPANEMVVPGAPPLLGTVELRNREHLRRGASRGPRRRDEGESPQARE